MYIAPIVELNCRHMYPVAVTVDNANYSIIRMGIQLEYRERERERERGEKGET